MGTCEFCGGEFSTNGLQQHRRSHMHDVLPVLPCPWDGCDRTFTFKCARARHVLAHQSIGKRFFDKVQINDETGCWEWTGGKTHNGYGTFKPFSTTFNAYLVSYVMFVGPMPAGLELDHLCRVRHCVNPDHLEPVTRHENMRRGIVARAAADSETGDGA